MNNFLYGPVYIYRVIKSTGEVLGYSADAGLCATAGQTAYGLYPTEELATEVALSGKPREDIKRVLWVKDTDTRRQRKRVG